ncbi:MAG: type II secretion system F family protein [Selenomonadaceae bacterium]|nr:type II secretion system F family protein [Selenomonadaceae bacterium]
MNLPFMSEEHLSLTDLYQFFRVIYRFQNAGVPVDSAVEAYLSVSTKENAKEVIGKVLRDMRNGQAFSEALKRSKEFPDFIVEIIKVGEGSGQVNSTLHEVVEHLKQEIDIDREITSSLWTPKIFLVGMGFAMFLAVMFVIPKMGQLLREAHIELPTITKFVLWIGDTAQGFWWVFALIGVGIFALYKELKRRYPEEVALLKFRLPFFKSIYIPQMQYRFTKTMGLCLVANVPTPQAIQYTALASDNIAMKLTLLRSLQYIEKRGMQSWDAIKKADTFHLIAQDIYTLLEVGASTSQMGPILMEESKNFQEDMLTASKLIGDKVGISVTIPGYIALIFLFAAIEWPVITMMQNMNMGGGM